MNDHGQRGESSPPVEIEAVLEEGVLRFGVGDPDHLHSSVWRLWATKKGDIYVGVRSILGVVKASLHASGRWHFALTSEYADRQEIDPDSRFWDTWERPEELGRGVTLGLQVYVPTSELRKFPVSSKPPMRWIEPGPDDGAVEIDLAIQKDDQVELQRWPGRFSMKTRPIGILGPVGEERDEHLWVLRQDVPFEDDFREKLDQHREKLRAEQAWPLQEDGDTRGFFWGHREDSRFIVEYTFD